MTKETVRVCFRSDDANLDWQSAISGEGGYEFINSMMMENNENPNWSKWTIIIDYKRNKNK